MPRYGIEVTCDGDEVATYIVTDAPNVEAAGLYAVEHVSDLLGWRPFPVEEDSWETELPYTTGRPA